MTLTTVITGGQVTSAEILSQSSNTGNYAVGQTFFIDDADVGSNGGSGFAYQLSSESTGISSVTGISLAGSGYVVGDVLSVDDTTVGSGGGSGFQYTVSNVGFATAATVTNGGAAFEATDTLILGDIGGVGDPVGSGLVINLDTIVSAKSIECSQSGILTLGETGGSTGQLVQNPNGNITATNWNIAANGVFTGSGISVANNINATGTLTIGSTSQFTGKITGNGGADITGAPSNIEQLTAKLDNGSAVAPTLTFQNSVQTGLFRQDADKIGITVAGVETGRIGNTGFDFTNLQVDSTVGNLNPFFKVDTSANKMSLGLAAQNIFVDATNTIGTDGTDISVPLNFDTKGEGNFVFKGGTNVDFKITDGTTDVVSIDSGTGTATFLGNLDAGKLRIRQNVVSNNSSAAVRSFGEVLALSITGSGSGYTDGTYTATATTSTGGGTGLTVTLTVASGTFSAATIVAKGQNYAIGDEITIPAAGGGSGLTILVSDIDGQGVVLKPSAGASILCDTTGSLVIPSGTTNERPSALDRVTGAIRFNSTQLQFEGYNGNDFVSLGGVRDVDQDTYVLTESSPGADEDTFEFYNQGVNSLSITKDKFTLKTAKTFDVAGTATFNGTAAGNPLAVTFSGADIFKVRSNKDIEIDGGVRLRGVPEQGAVDTIGTVTSVAGNYGVSQTYTGVSSNSQFEGINATFTVTTDGSGNIASVVKVAGGSNYEQLEVLTIPGNVIGGSTPTHDITFPVTAITNTVSARSRLDVLSQDYVTQLDSKEFISLDANGAQAAWKINRGWNAGATSYLTVFDSTGDFVELDDCRVEGGQLSSFPSTATIIQFDKTAFKGAKTLITIESDDNKVHMLEVTSVCASNGTTAHATVTNSITSDNNLMDATISVVGNNVNISLAKSSAATSSSNFTGRFTTTKVKV
jgi:hypothetical protein